MGFAKQAIFAATVAIIVTLVHAEVNVDANCLGCLCEASTKCNATTACHVPYPGAYFCGPFQISWAYWSDADKPVLTGDNPEVKGAFENCVQDLYCAAQTVRQYMAKFPEDCNSDGAITCIDIIRNHKFGRNGCSAPIPDGDQFWLQYQQCANNFHLN